MKTKITLHTFLLSLAVAGLVMLSASISAQQKPEDQSKAKKTITIHVTKEVDGKTMVIDTTVVTDGDFDADAFLAGKGVMGDDSEEGGQIERDIIIRHPGSQEFSWSGSDGNAPDTIILEGKRVIVLNDKFDMPAPPPPCPGMPLDFNFKMHAGFPPMGGSDIEELLEGLAISCGLGNVMPFGEMKQVVVKKKRNGKKVIITFEDRDEEKDKHGPANKKEEKIIIYKNGEQGMAPQNEERYINKDQTGETILITKNVETNGDEKTVTVKADVDKSAPVVKEKKVIIIKEEKTK